MRRVALLWGRRRGGTNNGANNGANNGENNGENNGANNGEENLPPEASDDTATTIAGMIVEILVLENDTDPNDGDQLEVKEFTQGANGMVAEGSKGALDYLPNDALWTGTDTFTYVVHDGNGGEDTATVTVTVTEQPTLTITSPTPGEVVVGDRVTIEFVNTACDFTSPSNNAAGCHGHKWLDGERWTDEQGSGFGHYDTGSFEIYPLAPGEHTFRFVLAVNNGTDEDWSPEVSAEVTFTVEEDVPDVPPAVTFDRAITSVAYTGLAGDLLLATPDGLHS